MFQESSVPGHLLGHLSKSEDAEEPSVVEDNVQAEDEIEAQPCDDVYNGET